MVLAEIIVDSREATNKKILEALRKYDDLDVKVEYLPAGDYIVHGNYIIERKTVTDLVASIRRNRLWDELMRIKMSSEVSDITPVVIIEGTMNLIKKFTDWNEASVVGIINAIVFKFKIPCIFTSSYRWTVTELRQLALSCVKEKRKKRVVLFVEKGRTDDEVALNMIASIPGVGGEKARRILREFRTVRNVANADVIDLMSVDGIGNKIANKIVHIFNYEVSNLFLGGNGE